ncbi:MAG: response regulator transcription factor [Clostridia bacterium]|nr:response regulator transcription factor [Clostridia bacterium]
MIYCVEDDAGVREMEVYTLRSMGFEADGFADGEAFFAALGVRLPELVLLDVMLPGEDGVSLLKRLKSHQATRSIPVIMATARGAEYEKVQSLDLGADDYLVKPFGMMEMVSRVRAVLRRSAAAPRDVLRAGGIELDAERHMVRALGERVELTLKEYELLRALMAREGMVFTRDALLKEVWGVDYCGESRTVDVHIRTLRQKLGKCGEQIMTVRGVGYKLESEGYDE